MTQQNEKIYIGTVKFFNDAKGFGMIECDDFPGDVFLHYSAIIMPEGGFQTVKDDEKVQFEVWNTPKGVTALNVKAIK